MTETPTSPADALCSEAAAASGLNDFGDDWFIRPLAAWAEDLLQPELTEFGRTLLPPILYVTGLERSGTTLLHNLVALHPQARALRRWELMEPLPSPTTETYETDPRIAKVHGARPAPPAELDPMGYDRDDVWADPAIAAYCDRYDVAPEHSRLTGTKDR